MWEAYGINLHFSPHFSYVTIEGTISVLSIDDDNYQFPEGSELVSAVYDISADKLFPAPVTVELQHCIPLHHDNEAPHIGMTFVIADTQQGPPYRFHELQGGGFRCGSSCGEIELSHFSKLAVIIKWRLGRPIPFFSGIYYTQNDRANFVVTQNLAAHITVSLVQ